MWLVSQNQYCHRDILKACLYICTALTTLDIFYFSFLQIMPAVDTDMSSCRQKHTKVIKVVWRLVQLPNHNVSENIVLASWLHPEGNIILWHTHTGTHANELCLKSAYHVISTLPKFTSLKVWDTLKEAVIFHLQPFSHTHAHMSKSIHIHAPRNCQPDLWP